MHFKIVWLMIMILLLVVGLVIVYLWPVPTMSFDQLYASVAPNLGDSLKSFRRAHPPKRCEVDGVDWTYIVAGQGDQTILFLHGMTGAHDIWWQQINCLSSQYKTISVTYPPVGHLADLEKGILAIVDREGATQFHMVGTSLGGYLAQYLMARHPDRVRRVVLANTFPPNDLIAEKNRVTGKLLPLMPQWLVINFFRASFRNSIYPSSGNSDLTLAFLNEIGYGRTSKAQFIGRFHCVIEKFAVASSAAMMIIESDNDPLVAPELREELKNVYPDARVHTFAGAGHFPYLNRPREYTQLLADFFAGNRNGERPSTVCPEDSI